MVATLWAARRRRWVRIEPSAWSGGGEEESWGTSQAEGSERIRVLTWPRRSMKNCRHGSGPTGGGGSDRGGGVMALTARSDSAEGARGVTFAEWASWARSAAALGRLRPWARFGELGHTEQWAGPSSLLFL
jgi:hypothetical protein